MMMTPLTNTPTLSVMEVEMEIISLVASLVSLAVSFYILRIMTAKPEEKGLTKTETNQIRQILNVMYWDGEMHEDQN